MTTAWRQNLILETHFGATLEHSSYRWGPRRRKEVEAAQDPAEYFVSRAGSHLIIKLSERQLRMMMFVLLIFFVACDVLLTPRSRPESPPE